MSFREAARAHFFQGNAHLEAGDLARAEHDYRRALALDPALAEAALNLGVLCHEAGRHDEADVWYAHAMSKPALVADAERNRARLLRDRGRVREAIARLDALIERGRGDVLALRRDRAVFRLYAGDWAAGWDEYDAVRFGAPGVYARNFGRPLWRGDDLAGRTVLVWAEQGIGDEVFFAGCLPDVIRRAGHVVIDCAPRLAPLFARSFPDCTVHGGTQEVATGWLREMPAIDAQIPIASLPRWLRRAASDFPAQAGYLRADPGLTAAWRERYTVPGTRLRVGLSWRGGSLPAERRRRSTTLAQWRALFDVPEVSFVDLQYGVTEVEREALRAHARVIPHTGAEGDPLVDFDGFAARIAALDLVISVDNSTVHLAGALGVPVWLLHAHAPDWRWGPEGEDNPWYPALRQLRAARPGDWEGLIGHAAGRLRARAAAPDGGADAR